MEVYSLLYTKSFPYHSPWGKTDFHTVFYPVELMSKQDVIEIEKRIHFPDLEIFDHKETVFYMSIKGKVYLIILLFRNLPNDIDGFGRGGIFLCQGFIFPSALWKVSLSHLALLSLVKNNIFEDRQQAFDSPLVDWKTGNFLPINVSENLVENFYSKLPLFTTEFEWRLANLFNKLASNEGDGPAFLIRGNPSKVSNLLDRVISYVPEAIKINLGWDSAFDGGNLNFFPLKIVAFTQNRPIGGKPIYIDLETQSIQIPDELQEVIAPQTPFELWFSKCRHEITNISKINNAYMLSALLTKGEVPLSENVSGKKSCFVSVCNEWIKNVFLNRISKLVGLEFSKYIAQELTQVEKLELLIQSLPPQKIAELSEKLILKNRLTPKTLKISLSEDIQASAGHILKLIIRVWNGEPLKVEDIEHLKEKERTELIVYLLLTDWGESPWLAEILKNYEVIFNRMLDFPETRQAVLKILHKSISKKKEFKEIVPFILKETINQGVAFSIFTGKISPFQILEKFFQSQVWSETDIRTLFSWSKKKIKITQDFPYVQAFLFPHNGISNEVLMDRNVRERLLSCLIRCHRYKNEELEKLGFTREEILMMKTLKKNIRVFDIIKGLLKYKV